MKNAKFSRILYCLKILLIARNVDSISFMNARNIQ